MAEPPAAALRLAADAGWSRADVRPLAGDASARRYWRLRDGDRAAVLMVSDPGDAAGTASFVRVAGALAALGLSAPGILHDASDAGMLLLEDLGDGIVAAAVATEPSLEATLYAVAVDALIRMQSAPPIPGLPAFDAEPMAAALDVTRDSYAGADAAAWRPVFVAMRAALDATAPDRAVTVHRDFHAENLIWLPQRSGDARIGLLDFQDAVAGHPAYDLVSLLQDARRDVTPGVAARTIARYRQRTGRTDSAFRAACAAQGAQRQLRILGVFSRLARQGRTGYLPLIPRVWEHLRTNLADPALADLARALGPVLPPPDAAHLGRLAAA